MRSRIERLEQKVIRGGEVTADEAMEMMELKGQEVYDLFPSANRLARRFKGSEVDLCAIVNAKSGHCREDCAFCAQSAHHHTDAAVYGLMDADEILEAAREAVGLGAGRFGIVTSGTGIKEGTELDLLLTAVGRIAAEGKVYLCASLGIVPEPALRKLRDAGLRGLHHNLETARSFFPKICSTHNYEEDVETVRLAVRLGFRACSGGIFGLGESPAQRVEMALTLRDLQVDSVPLNFLVPVKGTKLEDVSPLKPLDCLQIIAVYRFLLPRATLKVCAGRVQNMGDLASWIFYAGADGMMVGNFLTTPGRPAAMDVKMVRDLGLRPARGGHRELP